MVLLLWLALLHCSRGAARRTPLELMTQTITLVHLPLQALTNSFSPHKLSSGRPLPRPAFGSSPNLQVQAGIPHSVLAAPQPALLPACTIAAFMCACAGASQQGGRLRVFCKKPGVLRYC